MKQKIEKVRQSLQIENNLSSVNSTRRKFNRSKVDSSIMDYVSLYG